MSNYKTTTGAPLSEEAKQFLQDNYDPTVVEIKEYHIETGRFMEEGLARHRTINRVVLTDEQRELLNYTNTFELYAIPVGYDITLTTGDNE